MTPDGAKVYVACGEGVLDVIDVASGTRSTVVVGGAAHVLGLAVRPAGDRLYVTTGDNNVVSVNTATDTVVASDIHPLTGTPSFVAIGFFPDQAPTAAFTWTTDTEGNVHFDAGPSFSPRGDIATYEWDFDDGTSETTSGPTVTHTYDNTVPRNVTLTVTNTQGTSTTVVFTGQTLHRHGGPSAVLAQSVTPVIDDSSSSTLPPDTTVVPPVDPPVFPPPGPPVTPTTSPTTVPTTAPTTVPPVSPPGGPGSGPGGGPGGGGGSARLVVRYDVPGSSKTFKFTQACTTGPRTVVADYELGDGEQRVTPLAPGTHCTVREPGAPPGVTTVVVSGSTSPPVVTDVPPGGAGTVPPGTLDMQFTSPPGDAVVELVTRGNGPGQPSPGLGGLQPSAPAMTPERAETDGGPTGATDGGGAEGTDDGGANASDGADGSEAAAPAGAADDEPEKLPTEAKVALGGLLAMLLLFLRRILGKVAS